MERTEKSESKWKDNLKNQEQIGTNRKKRK